MHKQVIVYSWSFTRWGGDKKMNENEKIRKKGLNKTKKI